RCLRRALPAAPCGAGLPAGRHVADRRGVFRQAHAALFRRVRGQAFVHHGHRCGELLSSDPLVLS
ncbi:hypothetical protein AK812_SmicGene47383, partial [Symbiodinium microadriaticum]